MLNDRGFFGPSQYTWWVVYLVVGVVLVAAVIAWYVFAVRFSRTRLPPADRRPNPKKSDPQQLQAKYSGLIDEVEAEWRAGRLDDRATHSRLSLLLRFFAFESSGVDAHVMTLADLQRSPLPQVAGAVGEYYPPAFRADQPGDPAHALETARLVVRSWN
ncbi:hypothetical protein [Frondihabitans cladoniiphilus]|uniref:DUF4129 domain-containing protein n=1 Tax=Frondihabitans cladoniiphilus TaxID=715785 RepID=A0ABP8VL68_9MICO